MADERITILQKVVIADGARPLARVGDVIAHGQDIPDNVVRFTDRVTDAWHRLTTDPVTYTYMLVEQEPERYDGAMLQRYPRWWPMTVVEVDPDPQPAERRLIGPAHAHLDAQCTDACYEPAETPEQKAERHALNRPLREAFDRLTADALGSPDADSIFIHVEAGSVTLTQTTGRTLKIAANGAWAEAPDRERVTVDFTPAESGPLVLTLPQVPPGAGALIANGTRFLLDGHGQWTTEDGSWSGSLAGVFAEFAEDDGVTVEFAPPRKPRTWPKLDPTPSLDPSLADLGAVEVEGHGRWEHLKRGGDAFTQGTKVRTLRQLRELGEVREVLT